MLKNFEKWKIGNIRVFTCPPPSYLQSAETCLVRQVILISSSKILTSFQKSHEEDSSINQIKFITTRMDLFILNFKARILIFRKMFYKIMYLVLFEFEQNVIFAFKK